MTPQGSPAVASHDATSAGTNTFQDNSDPDNTGDKKVNIETPRYRDGAAQRSTTEAVNSNRGITNPKMNKIMDPTDIGT